MKDFQEILNTPPQVGGQDLFMDSDLVKISWLAAQYGYVLPPLDDAVIYRATKNGP